MRTFEGRPLARPDEEIVDQGLAFDLGTLASRRTLFKAVGLGASALGLTACGDDTETPSASTSSAVTTGQEIPDETAGPYPGDGSNGPDVLEQSGVVRSDIRASFGTGKAIAEGVPMTLELTILDLATDGAAYSGAAIYVWHCNRAGEYSMYSPAITGENYLRGVQVADSAGKVKFTSIFPACYSGRWPHIHFEVYPNQEDITDAGNAVATSQVALPKNVCTKVYAVSGYEASVTNLAQVSLDSDNVFGEDSAALQLATVTGDVTGGFAAALTVRIDTSNTPAGGQMGGGAPSGGPGGPGGRPPSGGPGGPPPSGGPGGPGGAPPSR